MTGEDTFLSDRYDTLALILNGNDDIKEPEIANFYNIEDACKLLKEHLENDDILYNHADVDFDGIGSSFEMVKFIRTINPNKNVKLCINKEKVHGISDITVNYFNKTSGGLVVILDSSSNCIDDIKKINHDVLVIDHHELAVDKKDLRGDTAGGRYVIVSNMIDNTENGYSLDKNYSAGMVVYEFIKYFQNLYGLSDIASDKKLYQWAVSTLFTDVINTDTVHNMYYVNKAFSDDDYEPTLDILMKKCNNFNPRLNKTMLNFSLAPLFNRAIRAGYSGKALDIAINNPNKADELLVFKDYQTSLLNGIEDRANEFVGYASIDLGKTGIHKNYNGLVASKLMDKFKKTSISYQLYKDSSGIIAKGSFRGLIDNIDYRKAIIDKGYVASGHERAFGFEIPLEKLNEVMNDITELENNFDKREYLTAGSVDTDRRGQHHIVDIDTFRKTGKCWSVGLVNSRISGGFGNVNIIFSLKDVVLEEEYEKYRVYRCGGLRCKSFEHIESPEVALYIEYGTELNFYLRNKWS